MISEVGHTGRRDGNWEGSILRFNVGIYIPEERAMDNPQQLIYYKMAWRF
jgi:hypothetical protein